jgi:hypothetical protein
VTIVPTVTATPAPVTYEWLDGKRWSTTNNGRTVEMTLETACAQWQDVEPYACLEKSKDLRMFHFWMYSSLTTDEAPLFFAVGQFSTSGGNLCFTVVNYWSEVPAKPFLIASQEPVCFDATKKVDVLVVDGSVFTSRSINE